VGQDLGGCSEQRWRGRVRHGKPPRGYRRTRAVVCHGTPVRVAARAAEGTIRIAPDPARCGRGSRGFRDGGVRRRAIPVHAAAAKPECGHRRSRRVRGSVISVLVEGAFVAGRILGHHDRIRAPSCAAILHGRSKRRWRRWLQLLLGRRLDVALALRP